MFRKTIELRQDAARRASSYSRASSDFAESFGIMLATVMLGSDRASRLPCEVWRITLNRRRAIMCALRKSVSAKTTMTEPSGWMAPTDNACAVELRALVGGVKGKTRDRQAAAARGGLIHGGCEVAIEGIERQQAAARIEQAAGVDRSQGAAQMRLEGVLADHRQRIGGHERRRAGYDFEIGQLVFGSEPVRRQHDRQVAETRVLGKHGEEGIHHPCAKAFAEHDAVDVAGVEMFRRHLDAQRADDAHSFTERYGKRGVGGAAADQQHGGVARGIVVGHRNSIKAILITPAHHRRVQCPHPKSGVEARDQTTEIVAVWRKRNRVFRKQAFRIHRDQRQIGLAGGNLLGQRRQVRCSPDGGSDHRGRLHLVDRARDVGPAGVDNGKHAGLVERGRKCRPPGI
jgi:hypothetical protein